MLEYSHGEKAYYKDQIALLLTSLSNQSCPAVLHDDGSKLCKDNHADQHPCDRLRLLRPGHGSDFQHDLCRIRGSEKEIMFGP